MFGSAAGSDGCFLFALAWLCVFVSFNSFVVVALNRLFFVETEAVCFSTGCFFVGVGMVVCSVVLNRSFVCLCVFKKFVLTGCCLLGCVHICLFLFFVVVFCYFLFKHGFACVEHVVFVCGVFIHCF